MKTMKKRRKKIVEVGHEHKKNYLKRDFFLSVFFFARSAVRQSKINKSCIVLYLLSKFNPLPSLNADMRIITIIEAMVLIMKIIRF